MNTAQDAEVAAKLERLRSELARQAAQIRRSSALGLVVGLLCVAGLSAYFYWGYSLFSETLQKDRVADTVATIVEENLPGVRKSLEEESKRSAPAWAEGLSKQLRDSLPMGRKKLEDYVVDRSKATLEHGTVLTEEQFTRFLRTNKDQIRSDLSELTKKPELADKAIADLETALQGQLDTDLKANANELVYILTAFTEKLGKLAKNQNLDETEGLERRLAMIVRRVQSEKVATADTIPKAVLPSPPFASPGSVAAAPVGEPRDAESVPSKVKRKPEPPKAEPRPEPPKEEAKPEAAKTEAPKEEPKSDAPKDEPKPEASKEAPKAP